MISVFGSILLIGAVVLPIAYNHLTSESQIEAISEAKVHARELVGKVKFRGRGPASVDSLPLEGVVGQDPWGTAYNYKVIRNAYGQPMQLVVWSEGPNKTKDTEEGVFIGALTSGEELRFRGDDLGYLLDLQ